jgi:predicted nucleotidyltransferase component of viral defense system
LFDQLVDVALRTRADLSPLRPVVEKELLHHDILREVSEAGLLAGLTFIGGTCLRACYGSARLSEDLDFTGGSDFRRGDLAGLATILTDRLQTRYGLPVRVSEPVKSGGNVSTWKLVIETRPGQKHLPAQRINVDICAIPSHDRRPMMLRNLYGVNLGTSGLILQAQSREEILADKVVALAWRENRIKNRDLWDILWLLQQGVELPLPLIPKKIHDRKRKEAESRRRQEDDEGLRERINPKHLAGPASVAITADRKQRTTRERVVMRRCAVGRVDVPAEGALHRQVLRIG